MVSDDTGYCNCQGSTSSCFLKPFAITSFPVWVSTDDETLIVWPALKTDTTIIPMMAYKRQDCVHKKRLHVWRLNNATMHLAKIPSQLQGVTFCSFFQSWLLLSCQNIFFQELCSCPWETQPLQRLKMSRRGKKEQNETLKHTGVHGAQNTPAF